MAHAKLSPSGAHRWMACPGSVTLEANLPDESSEYAEEGTAAHELAASALYLGCDTKDVNSAVQPDRYDDDMRDYVQQYVDAIREYAAEHQLFIEQKVPIGHITGEDGATGTADAIVIYNDGSELQVHDLKYGRGVEVSPDANEQMMLYALGALEAYDHLLLDAPRIRTVIHQVRLGGPKEWSCSYEDLMAFKARAAERAALTRSEQPPFEPGEDQCRFCKAKAHCQALATRVEEEMDSFFDDETRSTAKIGTINVQCLSQYMQAANLIEDWLKAVRARVEAELLQGHDVPGFKLVQGRKGARAWKDADEAEQELKAMRIKNEDMYDFKVKSPTSMEKFLKDQPKRWARLLKLITQADGKPSVAPLSDKRPAITPGATADDFDDLTRE